MLNERTNTNHRYIYVLIHPSQMQFGFSFHIPSHTLPPLLAIFSVVESLNYYCVLFNVLIHIVYGVGVNVK